MKISYSFCELLLVYVVLAPCLQHCANSMEESDLDLSARDGTVLPEGIDLSPADYERYLSAPPLGHFLTTATRGLNFRNPRRPELKIHYAGGADRFSSHGLLPFNTRLKAVGYVDEGEKWMLVFRTEDDSAHQELGLVYARWVRADREEGRDSLVRNGTQAPGYVTSAPKEGAQLKNRDFKAWFRVNDPYAKVVDNYGNGFDSLYGVRNFRVVLHGIFYRGGANNLYNKQGLRSNENPLPAVGLKNLCESGISDAVYLYSTNFQSAKREISCQMSGGSGHLAYQQISVLSGNEYTKLLGMIFDRIHAPEKGPIYGHCWNGWHASGLISALSLRQFCGYSGADAVNYWVQNTDGASAGYDAIRKKIRDFQPLEKWKVSAEIQARICP